MMSCHKTFFQIMGNGGEGAIGAEHITFFKIIIVLFSARNIVINTPSLSFDCHIYQWRIQDFPEGGAPTPEGGAPTSLSFDCHIRQY